MIFFIVNLILLFNTSKLETKVGFSNCRALMLCTALSEVIELFIEATVFILIFGR
jgi:hypothetical protein